MAFVVSRRLLYGHLRKFLLAIPADASWPHAAPRVYSVRFEVPLLLRVYSLVSKTAHSRLLEGLRLYTVHCALAFPDALEASC